MAKSVTFRRGYLELNPVFNKGKCRDIDNPDWFFEVVKARNGIEYAPEQKQFCQDCPIIAECYDYALRVDVRGVWGGTTHYERKQERKRLGIRAEQVGSNNDRGESSNDGRQVA